MLRAVHHDFLKPELLRLKIDCTTGTPVASIGGEALSSITDNGAGDFTLRFKEAFARTPIVAATPTTGTSAGGFCTVTLATDTSVRIVIRDSAGNPQDQRCYVAILGYSSPVADIARPMQSVGCMARNPRILCGAVLGAGTASTNFGTFTVTSPSTGVYNITPRIAYGSEPVILATPLAAGNIRTSYSGATIVVETFNTSGVATALNFNFLAIGSDAPATVFGRVLRTIREGSIAPRIVAFVAASGNASISTNPKIASIASGGTGIGTATLVPSANAYPSRAFGRTPVVIATCEGATCYASAPGPTASAIVLNTFNATGSATASATHVLALGWDANATQRN